RRPWADLAPRRVCGRRLHHGPVQADRDLARRRSVGCAGRVRAPDAASRRGLIGTVACAPLRAGGALENSALRFRPVDGPETHLHCAGDSTWITRLAIRSFTFAA